jgi:copper oxidase (laccase) domain-containing protein
VGDELYDLFAERYGSSVALEGNRVDLGRAIDIDLVRAGVDPNRIADIGSCTACENQRWFSYRAQKGVCGRHAALCMAL